MIVVIIEAFASVRGEPETPVPEVTVVIVCAAPKPLSPLNANVPVPPLEIFVRLIVGRFALINVQVTFDPAAVAAASRTSAPVARFGVAVPPPPIPEQAAEVSS